MSPSTAQDAVWICAGWSIVAVGEPLTSWAPVTPPPTARIIRRTTEAIAAVADQPHCFVLICVPSAPAAGALCKVAQRFSDASSFKQTGEDAGVLQDVCQASARIVPIMP